MALREPVLKILHEIGHDGSEIVFPDQPEPACRAGHHVQELIPVCLEYGFTVTPIELYPISRTLSDPPQFHQVRDGDEAWEFFCHQIQSSTGVIDGWSGRWGHAWAYDHGHVYDPDGGKFSFKAGFGPAFPKKPRCAWQLWPYRSD